MTSPPRSRAQVLLRTLFVVGIGTSVLALTGLALSRFFTDRPVAELLAEVDWSWLGLATICVLLGTASHGPRMRPLLPPDPGGRRPGASALGRRTCRSARRIQQRAWTSEILLIGRMSYFGPERNLDFFQFVLLTTLPQPPEWCAGSFFIVKVA